MAAKTKKTAVVLFNLGGPDSKHAIKPFLFNFFMDKNIIRLPRPFRYALAKLISKRRSQREANDSYSELGGGVAAVGEFAGAGQSAGEKP